MELDDILGQIPVQHREVQDHESSLFRSYFKDFQILDGGAESGFHHVSAAEYKPKLLQIRINKKGPFSRHDVGAGLVIKQVPLSFTSLNQGDVFIFDGGLVLYQWY